MQGGRKWFWFVEEPRQLPEEQVLEGGDNPTPEQAPVMVEVEPNERQAEEMTALTEKVVSLEKENEDLRRMLRETESRLATQETTARQVVERCGVMEATITQIYEHIQRQNVFDESAKTSITGLTEEVKKHRDGFEEVVRVLQNHELHITRNKTTSKEMAQCTSTRTSAKTRTRP